jgi:hypothetical protein
VTSHGALHQEHVLLIEVGKAVFGALQSGVHFVKAVLKSVQPGLGGVRHRFSWCTGRRTAREFGGGEGVSVNERVPRRTSLDFS